LSGDFRLVEKILLGGAALQRCEGRVPEQAALAAEVRDKK
jgi:hypothetical protein